MRLTHISFISIGLCVSPDTNSVSSLRIQAKIYTFLTHPVDTEKWHCKEHFEAHINVWKDCCSINRKKSQGLKFVE